MMESSGPYCRPRHLSQACHLAPHGCPQLGPPPPLTTPSCVNQQYHRPPSPPPLPIPPISSSCWIAFASFLSPRSVTPFPCPTIALSPRRAIALLFPPDVCDSPGGACWLFLSTTPHGFERRWRSRSLGAPSKCGTTAGVWRTVCRSITILTPSRVVIRHTIFTTARSRLGPTPDRLDRQAEHTTWMASCPRWRVGPETHSYYTGHMQGCIARVGCIMFHTLAQRALPAPICISSSH